MNKNCNINMFRSAQDWFILIIVLALLPGCQAKEPPLSQKAALVVVVQDTMARLSKALAGPLADRDLKEINFILENNFSGAGQEAQLPFLHSGVTGKEGIILASYPPEQGIGKDFSNYSVVINALLNKKISQKRLYLENRPDIIVICAPILDQEEVVVGTVWFVLDAEKVRKTWGVSTEEFLGINFNQ
jgi:hypothetical protein